MRSLWVLFRNELRLERRTPQLVLSMALFAAIGLTLLHAATQLAHPPLTLVVGLLVVTLVLATLLAVARVFTAEREEGLLDLLLLAPIPRTSIWAAKALAVLALLVVTELVAVPLFALLYAGSNEPVSPSPDYALLALLLLLADLGLAAFGAMIAILASATRSRELAVPVLFLPSTIPLVLSLVACVRASMSGGSLAQPLGSLLVYDALVIVLAWGVCEFVLTD